ncbi:bifunctional diguanylate cyclase/phosphodiesterase [Desulfosporosinus sp. PR]|uniref:sensor domain-containing protein n=1 Tax=Candidatus Desulfosporosinus nitrosoreducens TaxID=3401928 RepID=UPI0027FFF41A|nr:bifunctional diguanylate cyclase/phosphodiesterase [Desulfosporosinus sp. PR]MDQ7097026.1 bifunctional diguanylate cyclase/phosphodiesterase [Desulfosporosinus sp. PR]
MDNESVYLNPSSDPQATGVEAGNLSDTTDLRKENLKQVNDKATLREEELRQEMEELILTALYKELRESKDELRRQIKVMTRNNELMALSEERYKTLVNNSQDVIFSCDLQGAFTTINKKFCEVTGLPREMILGKTIKDIQSDPGYIQKWTEAFTRVIADGGVNSFTYRYERNLGSKITGYYDVTLSPLFDSRKRIVGVIGTNRDITRTIENENKIKHMTYYDCITDLPGRVLFLERLDNAIRTSGKNSNQAIIIILNIDNFKTINNTLGYAVGDILLVETATRLQKCLRGKNTVSHLNGDEFGLLLENVEQEDDIVNLLKRIGKIFDEPFEIKGESISLTASIGVSIYPDDGETYEELLKNAATAMQVAKKSGKNRLEFFNFKMKHEFLKTLTIERLLRKALHQREFVLYYQPQYTISGKLRGFEALIRWNSPEMGLLTPAEFIPIAEETGLIIQIGKWVLNTAILACKVINDKYCSDLIMSLNISPLQFREKEFSEYVIKAVKASGLNPKNLELEITESSFINNYDSVAKELKSLRDCGVRIALDDFGTGYSSLSYLKKLPIDLLKIDKSFIQEIDFSNPCNDLTESIIALVNKLNIETIAEGVETLEQLNFLVNAKCNYVQGYYFGKPSAEELIDDIVGKAIERQK